MVALKPFLISKVNCILFRKEPIINDQLFSGIKLRGIDQKVG